MGRHWHAVTVRTDGLAAVLGPLLTDPRIRSAALIDVDSGMVLDVCGPDTSAGRFGLARPAEHDHRDEVRGAAHAELVRIGLALAPAAGGLISLVLEAGPDRHILHTVADPHGGRLAMSVVVRGSERTVAKVRKRLRAVSEHALTAGPSVAVRPGSAGWTVPGPAGPGSPGRAASGPAGLSHPGPDPAGLGHAAPGAAGPGHPSPGPNGSSGSGGNPGPTDPNGPGGSGGSGGTTAPGGDPAVHGARFPGSGIGREPATGPGTPGPGYTGAPAVALPAPRNTGHPSTNVGATHAGQATAGAHPDPGSGDTIEATVPSRAVAPLSPAAAPDPVPDPARPDPAAAAAPADPAPATWAAPPPGPPAPEAPADHAAPAPADR
ncbi:hypothetical protein C8E95_4089 [Pseudonocardia autotrophica]|uniref:Uncharacterized protein n=1 Tax=Pseudonocardia autotrophica TaxID=2074 RepID=A0A1Y2MUC6_PSEAH|nr:hypothetical protein BG845_03954 [Pseudonocardia autotrophica]TDN74953.1 hypothetical protein C8E95_4089 [Pseudonocardia autotrophica]